MHKIRGSIFIKTLVTHGAILCVTGDLQLNWIEGKNHFISQKQYDEDLTIQIDDFVCEFDVIRNVLDDDKSFPVYFAHK